MELEITITTTIFINIDEIIKAYCLDYNSSDKDVKEAIDSYVTGLDDDVFYLIGEEEEEKIKKEVRKKIGKQMTLLKRIKTLFFFKQKVKHL